MGSGTGTEMTTYQVGTLTYTKRTLAVLFFWLLWGDACYMLMENVVPSILPLTMQRLGASNTLMGIVLSTIPMGINLVCNPIISFRSDRYRSRWGRRIPFILFTLLPLVFCLIVVGCGDVIGRWVFDHLQPLHGRVSPETVVLGFIATAMVGFSFFNSFVNSAFWYLFNDVVPEALLARFMAWFRVVSMLAIFAYNVLVFRFASTHATYIMVSAALLYAVGFGLMCLNVKEGDYPPPPPYEAGRTGVLGATLTYFRECHGLAHYWYVFIIAISWGGIAAASVFYIFFYQSTGLSLEQIGYLAGTGNVAMGAMIVIAARYADRHHPLRVVLAGAVVQVLLATPVLLLWVFWQPPPWANIVLWYAITIGLTSPAGAMLALFDPATLMRIFPRDRYGQFCSANALWRSLAVIMSGIIIGLFFDVMKGWRGAEAAYRTLPFVFLFFYALMLLGVALLYRSWKRYGGDTDYVPPASRACDSGSWRRERFSRPVSWHWHRGTGELS